jgi:hypothetical protein
VLHLACVIAKVKHFNAHPVLGQKKIHLGQIRFRSTSQDPQDVAAWFQERIDRGDEAIEVSIV